MVKHSRTLIQDIIWKFSEAKECYLELGFLFCRKGRSQGFHREANQVTHALAKLV